MTDHACEDIEIKISRKKGIELVGKYDRVIIRLFY